MVKFRMAVESAPDQIAFADELVAAGMALPAPVAGIYAWSEPFERLIAALARTFSAIGAADGPTTIRFPPLIARETIDRVKYRASFPHLLGDVAVWDGSSSLEALNLTEAPLVLAPAACYHVYPLVERAQPEDGQSFDVQSWCFRNESARDPARLRSFRMREFVRVGSAEAVLQWRERWIVRARELFEQLALQVDLEAAADPFFGAPARLQAAQQRAQKLKFELLAPITGAQPGAIMSFNYHRTHFGDLFDIRVAGGEVAHTVCVAFGMERIALALLRCHGMSLDGWPAEACDVLGL